MMDFIMAPAICGICVYGLYAIFALFVRRKERITLIEKLGSGDFQGDIKGNFKGDINIESSSRFGALKWGALLAGLGLGLLVGFLIANHYFPILTTEVERAVRNQYNEMRAIIYGASVLIFGGLALLIVFLIEYRLSKK
jgi:hypothetical protein